MTLRSLKMSLAAGALVLAGCATTLDRDDALTVVPYRITDDGRIVVRARVNDQGPYTFVLDTGSSISAVFDELRDELELSADPGKWASVQGLVTSRRVPLLTLDSVQVGSETWPDAKVASMPGDGKAYTDIDGILGVDFLRQYGFGFSAEDRIVRLYPAELIGNRSYRGWATVPLEPVSYGATGATLFSLQIEIGRERIPALFDLGAGLNLMNWLAAHSLGLDPIELKAEEKLAGALDSATISARLNVEEVRTAGVRWRNEQFSVVDIDIFSALQKGNQPLAILGSRFFSQREFVIDFTRNRLLIYVAMDEVDDARREGALSTATEQSL